MTKFGIKIEEALWRTPISVINQLLLFDDYQTGRRVRWKMQTATASKDLDAMLLEAMTLRH